MPELSFDDEEWPELPYHLWSGMHERDCAVCGKFLRCTLLGDIQPGFPDGEWMCRECL